MKKTISYRIMALALVACMMLGLCVLPKAKAATSQWTGIATAETYIVADANEPSDVTISNTGKAYYNKKIDVVEGTKISFDVNFSAYQAGTNMQYTFSLMDTAGCIYQNGVANGLSVELASTLANNVGPVKAVASQKTTGSNRGWLANFPSTVAADRNTADVYRITFEKLEQSGDNSWKISITYGSSTQEVLIPAAKVAHDLFQNGVYLAAGTMTGATGHVLNISNLKIAQPNTVSNWKVVRSLGLNGIEGELVPENTNAFDTDFNEFVTAYYDQKIKVQEGTTISFRVNFPKLTDGINVQYGFSLVDRAGSFYTSDTKANSLSLEIASVMNNGTPGALNAVASKKLAGASSRTFLANAFTLATARSTTDVYDVTFKKIDETLEGVNYSWMVTVMKNGTTPYAYRYQASDIPHDFFANGAYLAVGSMDGSATHTMNISKLNMSTGWSVITGTTAAAYDLVTEGADSFNASFRNNTSGYYNRKIDVVEGTTISMKVKPVVLKANTSMQFSLSMINAPKCFYQTGSADALSVEISSTASPWAVSSVVSKKVAGGSNRAWLYNVGTLSNGRTTSAVYTVTFEKLAKTEANSWKITVNNGTTEFTTMVEASKFAHDLFDNGLYIAAGSMNTSVGHNMEVFDLQITRPDAEASVGGVPYGDVLDAVQAADGETVTLVKDLDLTEELDLTGKEVTLDLEGNTISGAENMTLGAGTNLTLKGGELDGKLTLADNGATITADCDLALELDGKTATVNASNVSLTDTATDNGEEGGKVYGKLTAAAVTKENGISYVALAGQDEDGKYYTANAVRATLKRVSIRPAAAGIYFTTNFTFNKTVADAIVAAEQAGEYCGYGVVVSIHSPVGDNFITEKDGERLVNMWTKSLPTAGQAFISTGNSALIKNILSTSETVTAAQNAQRGAMDIHANAYVKIGDTVIMAENSEPITMSMKSVMQTFDTKLGNGELEEETTTKLLDFYKDWKETMDYWNLTNILEAAQ